MHTPRNLAGVTTGLWLLLAAAAPVIATTANDVCAPSADPCLLQKGTTLLVTPGSVLDFGSRAFVLPTGSGTKLDIGSGSVTINAGSLTLNPGSSIVGAPACPLTPPFPAGGSLTVNVQHDVAVLRDGNAKARIDVSNCSNPGAIRINAGGSIRIEGTLTAQGTQADAGYGTIDIVAMHDVTIPGEVTAAGGGFSGGGEVYIGATQGEINLSGSIDASGGDGGGVAFTAGSRILTTEAGLLSRIDARATAGGGSGGDIDLAAGTDVTIGSPLHAQGEASLDLGGDGGQVLITAGGVLTLNAVTNLFGTVPDGIGGDADLSAALDIIQNAAIDSSGKRSFGAGGIVELFAQRNLVAGSINANGDCEDCSGGDIDLEAWCSLTIPAAAVIDARGPAGTVLIQSGGSTDVLGTIVSGSSIDFLYSPSGTPPNLAGAIAIIPEPAVTSDVTIIRCGGPGLCDRDGIVEAGEECDDGNSVACDTCSNSCKFVVCGNDRLDGPCEECDDGNTADCDGCRGDCSRSDHVCGDGIQECGEPCDPGSAVSCNAGDTCSAQCGIEICGNGVQECDEECDLGAQNGQPGVLCAIDCVRLASTNCGNGTPEPLLGEQCDDGNTADCDGCNHVCETESCGNNVPECLEECDDGNTSTCDGCTPECVAEVCGNDVVDCGEECDEGDQNGQPGSTCLAGLCRIGQICSSESTGPCIPCGDALECDPLGLCGGAACEAGVCTPTTLACDDTNPCTTDGCDALTGCTHALRNPVEVPECDDGDPCTDPVCNLVSGCQQSDKTGFASVDCRLTDLDGLLAGDGVDPAARSSLAGLVEIAHTKVGAAETAQAEGKKKKVKVGLKSARKKLVRFGKKVVKLEPLHITDPEVAALLSEKSFDATQRIDDLRTELGL
jgi:cysteine-rich repeat protein